MTSGPCRLVALLLPVAAPLAAVAAPPLLVGSVDVIAEFNENLPGDRVSFTPGYGVTGRRANELSLNLVSLGARMEPEPLGFVAILSTGSSADFVHAFEPVGSGVGPEVLRFVQQASISWAASHRLVIEAGVYPSHIGFETFPSQANWNATRSVLGDLSPYYQAGIKAAYQISDHFSAQVHALNGWQVIADNNNGKTAGVQLAFTSGAADLYLNGLVGPELPDDDEDVRILGDVVAVVRPTRRLQLAGTLDLAREDLPAGGAAHWGGAGLWGRYAATDGLAFAARGEVFADPDGAISGAAQTLKEITGTLELRAHPALLVRLEGRHDVSTARVFTGANGLTDSQTLVLLQAVATFEKALE